MRKQLFYLFLIVIIVASLIALCGCSLVDPEEENNEPMVVAHYELSAVATSITEVVTIYAEDGENEYTTSLRPDESFAEFRPVIELPFELCHGYITMTVNYKKPFTAFQPYAVRYESRHFEKYGEVDGVGLFRLSNVKG